jgi:DNA topoisomerase-2
MKEQNVEKLSERMHVLTRPAMYIGGVEMTSKEGFFFEDGKFQWMTWDCNPGFLKIINEIIDNSIDEAIRTDFKHANQIKIYMDSTSVVVEDNGRGIPIEKVHEIDEKTGKILKGKWEWAPVLAFSHARAGANFGDNRSGIGMNGIGSFATNCFSKSFKVDTRHKGKRLQLTCTDNALHVKAKVSEFNGQCGTKVVFVPDVERFKLEEICELHMSLIQQRLIHLAMTFPLIRFKFNGKTVGIRSARQYVSAFSPVFEMVQTDDYLVAVMPNPTDDFRHSSFVNGLHTSDGGIHVDLVAHEVTVRIREKLKRYKVKPGDIKNKMQVIVVARNFPDPDFDSQTKQKLMNSLQHTRNYFDDMDWDKFAYKLWRTSAFIEPIVETYKIREELKKRQEAKNKNRDLLKKKVKNAKYFPASNSNLYLTMCEGESARGAIMPILGRDEFGYLELRGVPLNAKELPPSQVLKNAEFQSIIQVLGMDISSPVGASNLDYQNVLIATDQDADGAHIKGLVIGFFMRFAKEFVKRGGLKTLRTPLITLSKKGVIKEYFFTLAEYEKWNAKRSLRGYDVMYYKGLGTWEKEDLQALIKQDGLDHFIVDLTYDEDAEEVIDDWLVRSRIDKRKEYIREAEFDIFSI